MNTPSLDDHASLNHAAIELERSAVRNDERLEERWTAFESEVIAHLAAEEIWAIREASVTHRELVDKLLDEHVAIRHALVVARQALLRRDVRALLLALESFRLHQTNEELGTYKALFAAA